jgi:hypothetical protein
MPYPIEEKLVVAVSSSALFALDEADNVFRTHGTKAYRETKLPMLLCRSRRGLFGVLCNIAVAAGNVICALLKYIILPFGLFLCICYIIKYGLLKKER